MDGVADLRVILIVVVSLIFLVLFMSLVYVLYRRIMFRQRSQSGVDPETPGDAYQYDSHVLPPSKELLYFFCWEYDNGPVYSVEPSYRIREGVHLQVQPHDSGQGSYGCELKWPKPIIVGSVKPKQEKEFSDCDEVVVPPEDAEVVVEVQDDPVIGEEEEEENTMAEEMVEVQDDPVMEEEEEEDTMPFSTACPSPFFYTPFSSPGRDEESALGNISTGRVLQSS